jgi:5'-nucleotidase
MLSTRKTLMSEAIRTARKYYWLTGEFVNFDRGRDTDVWALNHNYVSVVPVQFDLTHYKLKEKLEKTFNAL